MSNYFGDVLSHIESRSKALQQPAQPVVFTHTVNALDGYLPAYNSNYKGFDTYCSLIDEDEVREVKVHVDLTKLHSRIATMKDKGEQSLSVYDCVEVTFIDADGEVVEPRSHAEMDVRIATQNLDRLTINTCDKHNDKDRWICSVPLPE
jgi:hypothetical protein